MSWSSTSSGVKRSGSDSTPAWTSRRWTVAARQEAVLAHQPVQLAGISLAGGPLAGELELRDRRVDRLEQAEVEERHGSVGLEDEVAGMRVAAEAPVAVHAAEVEPEDDLAHAVANGLVARAERLEARPLDPVADETAYWRALRCLPVLARLGKT